MSLLERIRAGLGDRAMAVGLWWRELEPAERVLYRAMALIGAGLVRFDWGVALIVPGAILALVFFGFSLAPRPSAGGGQDEEG